MPGGAFQQKMTRAVTFQVQKSVINLTLTLTLTLILTLTLTLTQTLI